jgi:hypothetical protein
MYVCTLDQYCPDSDVFESIDEFIEMCFACFGSAPQLHVVNGGDLILNEDDLIVLIRMCE